MHFQKAKATEDKLSFAESRSTSRQEICPQASTRDVSINHYPIVPLFAGPRVSAQTIPSHVYGDFIHYKLWLNTDQLVDSGRSCRKLRIKITHGRVTVRWRKNMSVHLRDGNEDKNVRATPRVIIILREPRKSAWDRDIVSRICYQQPRRASLSLSTCKSAAETAIENGPPFLLDRSRIFDSSCCSTRNMWVWDFSVFFILSRKVSEVVVWSNGTTDYQFSLSISRDGTTAMFNRNVYRF